MKRLLLLLLVSAGMIPSMSPAQIIGDLYIVRGETQVLEFDAPTGRYVVGDNDVVAVTPVSGNSLYLTGLSHGATNIQVMDADRVSVIGELAIQVGPDLEGLRRQVRAAIPGAEVTLEFIDNTIFASGTLPRLQDTEMLRSILDANTDSPSVVSTYARPELISLDVRVVEVRRSYGIDLGPELFPYNSDLITRNTSVAGGVVSRLLGDNNNVFALLDFLEERGYARTLSRPVLTTVSDRTGSFLAGGEIPVTTVVDGNASTEYKQFGVLLEYTPSLQPDGSIYIDITPEVSSVDFANTVDGKPQFNTRRVSTSVRLDSGSTLVLAGLFQSSDYRNLSGVPFLARLPIIGPFFRNAASRDEDTELVVIVTPQIGPINAEVAGFDLTNSSRAANVEDTISRGNLERGGNSYDVRAMLAGESISGHYGPVIEGLEGLFNAN